LSHKKALIYLEGGLAMIRYKLIIIFASLVLTASEGVAKCTPKERIELGKQGYAKAEVNKICEQDTSTEENESDDLNSSDEEKRKPKSRITDNNDNNNNYSNLMYCCDAYGNKRCAIGINPGPIGSPCWCYGIPGTGFTCK
jgi:hypothetical protein